MAEVPPGVVTVTSTVPVSAGAVMVSDVGELNVVVAASGPTSTVVAPETNPLPVMVITVPPLTGPLPGLMAVMVGAGS